jgi:Asp-tRNA(Asn)/Glu-tRNA(Gln) amidotransferase A subunit family amidase
VPVGLGDDGLPVSVQLLGLRGQDGVVLAAAEAVQRLVDFNAHPPAQSIASSDRPLPVRGDTS